MKKIINNNPKSIIIIGGFINNLINNGSLTSKINKDLELSLKNEIESIAKDNIVILLYPIHNYKFSVPQRLFSKLSKRNFF